jgi:hypothetical protein
VVRHVAPVGVDLLHVPPGVQAAVGVRCGEQRLESPIAPGGDPDLGQGDLHAHEAYVVSTPPAEVAPAGLTVIPAH